MNSFLIFIITFILGFCFVEDIKTMDNNKLKDALLMAKQLDSQQNEGNKAVEDDKLDKFLKVISMIESSGGLNFDHSEIQKGIHAGDRAIGSYGLMPNTVGEVVNRMQINDNLPENLKKYQRMPSSDMKSTLESMPEDENVIAKQLAKKVLNNYNDDEEKAAYSWYMGHNLTPKEVESRPYKENDYVQKYNRFKNKLFGK